MEATAIANVSSRRPVPQFEAPGLLGALPFLRDNPLDVFIQAAALGDVVKIPIPFQPTFFVNHPALLERMLMSHVKTYSKRTHGYRMMRRVLGNGLLTSSGDFWLRQRRIAQPAFHRNHIHRFGLTMARAAQEMVTGWEPRLQSGECFDVSREMMRVTLKVVGETLLSSDVMSKADTVGRALTEVLEMTVHLASRPLSAFPLWVPTPFNRTFVRARANLDQVVLDVIARRRAEPTGHGDLLEMLMTAVDAETGESMNDAQLRDEVMTIFLAGHETTANALSWSFYLLSKHPAVERALRAELTSALGDRAPTPDDMPKLGAAVRVIKEAMRLYPPVWMMSRHAEEADVLDGVEIPRGALMLVCNYMLHRRADVWPNPEGFDPDRWLEPEDRRPRCAFNPFSSGPRKCIGDGFAMMEAPLILATVLQRVQLVLKPGFVANPEPIVTLRPKNGLPMSAVAVPGRQVELS